SRTATATPARVSSHAVHSPAIPPPTTTTSTVRSPGTCGYAAPGAVRIQYDCARPGSMADLRGRVPPCSAGPAHPATGGRRHATGHDGASRFDKRWVVTPEWSHDHPTGRDRAAASARGGRVVARRAHVGRDRRP